MIKDPPPTPYPDINAILFGFLSELRGILADQLVGLYLHGSLACGDFNPITSDVDFLVVTQRQISTQAFSSLEAMHAHLFGSRLPWSQKLEGAYIPKDVLFRHDPQHHPLPWLGVDGHFAWERLGSDWVIQRWILREKGLVVFGPPLQPLIAPVTADDLRQAVRTSLKDWWSPPFPSPGRFQNDEYLAYTVLTMCRSLYVLENGRITSKPAAARWAMEKYKDPWFDLISAASAWSPGVQFPRQDEVFNLISFALELWDLPASS